MPTKPLYALGCLAMLGCSSPGAIAPTSDTPDSGASMPPTMPHDAGRSVTQGPSDAAHPRLDASSPSRPAVVDAGDGLVLEAPLTLSESTVHAGDTVTGKVTYRNAGSSPIVVQAAVIAARPPGGTHAGGPFDDFAPSAASTTIAPGALFTVTSSRTFAGSDPLGAWDLYPTFEDASGAWHDGPDQTLRVSAGSDASPPDAGVADGGSLIAAPLTGNVTTGSWQSGSINGMSYQYLLPYGYSTAHEYPLVLYLHQLDNATQIPSQIDPWFNNVTYRTDYPSIVIAPQCDMTADPSGQTLNWGGVSSGDQPCQDDALALVAEFMTNESVYAPKVYVTGNSMGGIGSWDLIIKYNTRSPTVKPLFAAALILAGATYDWGYPTPNASVVAALAKVPIWAIHGAQDTTVPLAWDENLYAAEQAGGGLMKLLVDPSLGHDVWDTYYVPPTSQTYWSWLFAQEG